MGLRLLRLQLPLRQWNLQAGTKREHCALQLEPPDFQSALWLATLLHLWLRKLLLLATDFSS